VLDPNADRLSELMQQMSGLVQLNLKGRYDEELLLKAIVASNPKVAQLRERVRNQRSAPTPQQLALGQLVEQEIARWREADRAAVRDTLGRFAEAVRDDEGVNHPSAFSVAFLVNRDVMDDFGRGVAALREAFGDRIELRFTGPLPPFSFADAELAMGAGSWA
jgi:hypothetical protein